MKRYNVTTDSEFLFFQKIKPFIHTIFDVGSRDESEFIDFEGEVHYFDPVPSYIRDLSAQPNKNTKSVFNAFGLGETNEVIDYYPGFASFYDRVISCGRSDAPNKCPLQVIKSKDYMLTKEMKSLDFLKIDTEGFEFHVIKGFEEIIQNVKVIQFEYGGTYLDCKTKLSEVVDYLSQHGFHKFAILTDSGPVPVTDFTDNYQYSNYVCVHKSCEIDYF